MSQATRFIHRDLVNGILGGRALPDKQALARAITKDRDILRMAVCNLALYDELALLLAQKTDLALAVGAGTEDVALRETQEVLASRLACMPTDGKAWLDYAVLSTYREGITLRAIAAYEMSARMAPGESWLAEKRLMFALSFRAVFDETARTTALDDIVVLQRAHPNRLSAVMKEAQVNTPLELASLFATGKR